MCIENSALLITFSRKISLRGDVKTLNFKYVVTLVLCMPTEASGAQNPYAPTDREWEDKQWLYEQYWGQVKTVAEMAMSVDVSRETLYRQMDSYGIPRRPPTMDVETPTDVARAYAVNHSPTDGRGRVLSSDNNVTWVEIADG